MNADYVVRPMTVADTRAVERLSDASVLRPRRAHAPDRLARARAPVARAGGELDRPDRAPRSARPARLLGRRGRLRRDRRATAVTAGHDVAARDVRRPARPPGKGVGRQVLDAALSYGPAACAACWPPPRTRRPCGATGSPASPCTRRCCCGGSVPRAALPVVERVRDGSFGDLDLLDSVDRQVRDSAHGVDHEILARLHRLVVADRSTGSGYAYVPQGGGAYLLAATNRRTATDLLWEALAASPRPAGRRRPHHGRERVGHRCRDGLQDGAVDPRLPRAARHEAAGALPAERPLPVRVAVKGCRCDNN